MLRVLRGRCGWRWRVFPPRRTRRTRSSGSKRRAGGRKAAGIPVALLDSKVAEGRAKGVPMDRIAMAVERRLGSLQRAREAMGGRAARRAGDPGRPVRGRGRHRGGGGARRCWAAWPPPRRATSAPWPSTALTQLVSQGESSERALARVTSALQRGPEALRRLPGEAAAERSRGNGPPPGRGNQGQGGARGRGQGGPPAAVPGPTQRPGQGRGRGNNPNKPE